MGGWPQGTTSPIPIPIFIQNRPHYGLLHLNFTQIIIDTVDAKNLQGLNFHPGRKKLQYADVDDLDSHS